MKKYLFTIVLLLSFIGSVSAQSPIDKETISIDEMPVFPGGSEGLRDYLSKNIKYPKESKLQGHSGRVVVEFIIDKKGNVTETKIASSPGFFLLEQEALRIINAMPKWKPGKDKGKKVIVKFQLPIKFTLGD